MRPAIVTYDTLCYASVCCAQVFVNTGALPVAHHRHPLPAYPDELRQQCQVRRRVSSPRYMSAQAHCTLYTHHRHLFFPAYLDELRQQSQVVVCHDVASYSGETPCPVAQVVVWTGAVDGTRARGCAVGLRVEVTSQ